MEKLPQPIMSLLGEVGEKSVLIYLSIKAFETKQFEVFKNINEPGYDILFRNKETGARFKIEVKTRQRLYSTGEGDNFSFDVTDIEYTCCDVVICYWWERNLYFVVPKDKLYQTSSNGKSVYKLWVKPKVNGNLNDDILPYVNNWKILGI
ncbi:MAG: hypothetical protein AB7I27_19130 [Bacteriovoracaceae bacterium]